MWTECEKPTSALHLFDAIFDFEIYWSSEDKTFYRTDSSKLWFQCTLETLMNVK